MSRTGIETIICLSPNFLYVYVYTIMLPLIVRLSLTLCVSNVVLCGNLYSRVKLVAVNCLNIKL